MASGDCSTGGSVGRLQGGTSLSSSSSSMLPRVSETVFWRSVFPEQEWVRRELRVSFGLGFFMSKADECMKGREELCI